MCQELFSHIPGPLHTQWQLQVAAHLRLDPSFPVCEADPMYTPPPLPTGCRFTHIEMSTGEQTNHGFHLIICLGGEVIKRLERFNLLSSSGILAAIITAATLTNITPSRVNIQVWATSLGCQALCTILHTVPLHRSGTFYSTHYICFCQKWLTLNSACFISASIFQNWTPDLGFAGTWSTNWAIGMLTKHNVVTVLVLKLGCFTKLVKCHFLSYHQSSGLQNKIDLSYFFILQISQYTVYNQAHQLKLISVYSAVFIVEVYSVPVSCTRFVTEGRMLRVTECMNVNGG